jgi:phosphoribosyl 1,2-cyclic phosphate phosphodiesterase
MTEVQDLFVEQGVSIDPLEIKHKDWDILGYRINNFAYITDCSSIPDNTIQKLKGLDLLILDSLRFSPHESHLSVDQAIEIVDMLKPKQTILTHLSSELDYYDLLEYLPNNIKPGFDGLILNI